MMNCVSDESRLNGETGTRPSAVAPGRAEREQKITHELLPHLMMNNVETQHEGDTAKDIKSQLIDGSQKQLHPSH